MGYCHDFQLTTWAPALVGNCHDFQVVHYPKYIIKDPYSCDFEQIPCCKCDTNCCTKRIPWKKCCI